jgi:hypothetical protein
LYSFALLFWFGKYVICKIETSAIF